MLPKKKNLPGFTLIELLVVIAIIAMLASIVLASLSSARLKARDAKRLADLKEMQSALELYFSDHNAYPASGANTELSEVTGLTPTYIGSIPKDPIRVAPNDYRYCSGLATAYTLITQLEKAGSGGWCSMTVAPGDTCGWSTTYSACGQ